MNVYSVAIIPSLKIKFCQWMGCATTMSVEELEDRVHRLEKKCDRFETQIKQRRIYKIPSLHEELHLK